MLRSFRSHLVVVMASGIALALAGCAGMGPHEQQDTELGCVSGAIGGGLLGLALGNGNSSSALLGAGSGLLAGCAAGNVIGRQLDAQDRMAAEQATYAALDAPPVYHGYAHRHYWNSDHGTGNHGYVTVKHVTRTASGGECKELNEVAYIKGQEVNQPSKFCKSPDGSWTAA